MSPWYHGGSSSRRRAPHPRRCPALPELRQPRPHLVLPQVDRDFRPCIASRPVLTMVFPVGQACPRRAEARTGEHVEGAAGRLRPCGAGSDRWVQGSLKRSQPRTVSSLSAHSARGCTPCVIGSPWGCRAFRRAAPGAAASPYYEGRNPRDVPKRDNSQAYIARFAQEAGISRSDVPKTAAAVTSGRRPCVRAQGMDGEGKVVLEWRGPGPSASPRWWSAHQRLRSLPRR